MMHRRSWIWTVLSAGAALARQTASTDAQDWLCPMDPDVHADKPGKCPRCGMKLVLRVPERREYPVEVTQSPRVLRAGGTTTLTLRVIDPDSNLPVKRFDIVHEKLIHLFLVSENLEFFAHVHPVPQDDGSFKLVQRLPLSGMYRLLADFYPSGSVPQLSVNTIFVSGKAAEPHLVPSTAPCKSENLSATLVTDPGELTAGLESKLFFTLDPADQLEPYLGAWGHMLVASEDLVDLLHLHPFYATGSATVQFNVIFPRPGLYRIWTQFQRRGQVNSVQFTVPVRSL